METRTNASMNQAREPTLITSCISGTYSSQSGLLDGLNGTGYSSTVHSDSFVLLVCLFVCLKLEMQSVELYMRNTALK